METCRDEQLCRQQPRNQNGNTKNYRKILWIKSITSFQRHQQLKVAHKSNPVLNLIVHCTYFSLGIKQSRILTLWFPVSFSQAFSCLSNEKVRPEMDKEPQRADRKYWVTRWQNRVVEQTKTNSTGSTVVDQTTNILTLKQTYLNIKIQFRLWRLRLNKYILLTTDIRKIILRNEIKHFGTRQNTERNTKGGMSGRWRMKNISPMKYSAVRRRRCVK